MVISAAGLTSNGDLAAEMALAEGRDVVVVWGNCQTEPIAQFLTPALARHGLHVVPVPPVYLVNEAELSMVRRLVARCTVLVTQPVRQHYRFDGDGSEDLIALVPTGARVVRIPAAFDATAFPYQFVGHLTGGDGIFAPLTSYHDLRIAAAASYGWSPEKTLKWWPGPADAAALRAVSAVSLAEMRRREAPLDVTVSETLGTAKAMFTVNHPSNRVLVHVANGVLRELCIDERLDIPAHEELDHTRTPLEPEVLAAHGWPSSLQTQWSVGGEPVRHEDVVEQQLALYRDWPEVVVEARRRHDEQMTLLGL